ncbi:MAG: glycosyltransferase family 8 protein [Lachnospiraceae bacterium]|nr:glycosyltransferase family 8 protein [Lachnospiraceae bacterium]
MNINMAASFNQKYLNYAYVMLFSFLENQNKGDDICAYVLESDLDNESKEILDELFKKYGACINFIHVNPADFPRELKTNEAWSLEIYYRLLLPYIIDDVETMLYLDVDVIVNQSVRELFSIDWEEKMVYAYPDVNTPPFGDKRDELLDYQLSTGYKYFCSGVMLMNLKKIRKEIRLTDFWELAKKWNYEMIAPDQDLLNGIFWNKVGYLEDKYSVYSKYAFNKGSKYEDIKESACIIHFAGDKPWQGQYVHYNIEQLWWDYAKRTPFYNEFLENFVNKCINDNLIYDTLTQSLHEKEILKQELAKASVLLKRLTQFL